MGVVLNMCQSPFGRFLLHLTVSNQRRGINQFEVGCGPYATITMIPILELRGCWLLICAWNVSYGGYCMLDSSCVVNRQ